MKLKKVLYGLSGLIIGALLGVMLKGMVIDALNNSGGVVTAKSLLDAKMIPFGMACLCAWIMTQIADE